MSLYIFTTRCEFTIWMDGKYILIATYREFLDMYRKMVAGVFDQLYVDLVVWYRRNDSHLTSFEFVGDEVLTLDKGQGTTSLSLIGRLKCVLRSLVFLQKCRFTNLRPVNEL